jgi:hypothetical protein
MTLYCTFTHNFRDNSGVDITVEGNVNVYGSLGTYLRLRVADRYFTQTSYNYLRMRHARRHIAGAPNKRQAHSSSATRQGEEV